VDKIEKTFAWTLIAVIALWVIGVVYIAAQYDWSEVFRHAVENNNAR